MVVQAQMSCNLFLILKFYLPILASLRINTNTNKKSERTLSACSYE